MGQSARVWARAPGCGPERQGVGQSARVWARAPGCGPERPGTGIALSTTSTTIIDIVTSRNLLTN